MTLRAKIVVLFAFLLAGIAFMVLQQSGWPASDAASAAPSPDQAVIAAWKRVQARGSYEFSSDIVQTTIPEATIFNVGRSSREERLHLEGQTDIRTESMSLKLWSDAVGGGGSSLVSESGIQVEVAGAMPAGRDGNWGRQGLSAGIAPTTRTRSGNGAWEDVEGLLDGIAPQGDFLAYLAAMRDVGRRGNGNAGGVTFHPLHLRHRWPRLRRLCPPAVAAHPAGPRRTARRRANSIPRPTTPA